MRVELVSLRNGITKKKRLNVVSDAINKSKSDLVLFCGHSVFDWNDCVELSEKLVNKDSIVLFEAKKVDESTFLMRKNCLFRIEQGRLVNMFTNQFFASSKEIEGKSDFFSKLKVVVSKVKRLSCKNRKFGIFLNL